MFQVAGAFSELERSLILSRQAEGIALAKERGAYKGQAARPEARRGPRCPPAPGGRRHPHPAHQGLRRQQGNDAARPRGNGRLRSGDVTRRPRSVWKARSCRPIGALRRSRWRPLALHSAPRSCGLDRRRSAPSGTCPHPFHQTLQPPRSGCSDNGVPAGPLVQYQAATCHGYEPLFGLDDGDQVLILGKHGSNTAFMTEVAAEVPNGRCRSAGSPLSAMSPCPDKGCATEDEGP